MDQDFCKHFGKACIAKCEKKFWEKFDQLIQGETVVVSLTLETSYLERSSNYSLWGLLVNAGYLTALEAEDETTALVKIPNDEVLSEFQTLLAEISGIEMLELKDMFQYLLSKDMKAFFEIYESIVLSCTSYMDAAENAYHMLFLGARTAKSA